MSDAGETAARALQVLVADDSATIRAVLVMELEDAGYEVVAVEDGAQALTRAAGGDIDVILLDIEMPVLDGYETLRRLKADSCLRDIPVVFLTGRVGSEELAEALHLGAHDYLRKPPEPVELIARVAAACPVKVLQDQLRQHASEMEAMSHTDFLAGLSNGRHMEEQLHATLARARRSGQTYAALIIDVDHFKRVNDALGHEAGDEVLREVARRLQAGVREVDAVGRWGGEEFLLAVSDTEVQDAEVLAERVGMLMHRTPPGGREFPCPVTVSIGVAVSATAPPPELLRCTDEKLYAAREAGRDQWQVGVA